MTSAVIFFELFEIDTLVAFDGDEIIVLFFVITYEEVFGVAAWIWYIDTAEFGHVVNCFVLGNFVFNIVIIKIFIGFNFVHRCNYSIVW